MHCVLFPWHRHNPTYLLCNLDQFTAKCNQCHISRYDHTHIDHCKGLRRQLKWLLVGNHNKHTDFLPRGFLIGWSVGYKPQTSLQRQKITQHWKVYSHQQVGHSQAPNTNSVFSCVIHQSVLRLRVNQAVIRKPLLLDLSVR